MRQNVFISDEVIRICVRYDSVLYDIVCMQLEESMEHRKYNIQRMF